MPVRPPAAISRVLARPISTASSTSTPPTPSSSRLPPLLPSNLAPALPTNSSDAISLLRSQTTPSTGIYCLARLYSRTYLLHPRDILTIPSLKSLPTPGTTLNLTRILEVGSRDYAIRSPAADGREIRKLAWLGKGKSMGKVVGEALEIEGENEVVDLVKETIPSWIATCELTVIEHTKSPLTRTELKKRRKGYKKTIENKQGWTRLRVGDIVLGDGVPST